MSPGSPAAVVPVAAGPRLRVGLVNNMPDAALTTTERQFRSLLGDAADLQLLFLPEIERGEMAQRYLRTRYEDVRELGGVRLDALIVTGTEPRTPDLRAEPFWPSFVRLLAWAETNTGSSVWSCLAAHAAVLALDGVERRRLHTKCSGVFQRVRVGGDPLAQNFPVRSWVPHSRHNGLDEDDLIRAGYALLSRVEGAGVDAFVRRGPTALVFLQGHPEYDADTLAREYQRDFMRYLRGKSVSPPTIPEAYFDAQTRSNLDALAAEAERNPGAEGILRRVASLTGQRVPDVPWRASAHSFYAGWLASLRGVAAGKALRT